MKRYLSLVALMLCALVFAACGDATATPNAGSTGTTSTAGAGTTSTAGTTTTSAAGTSTTSTAGTTTISAASTTSAVGTSTTSAAGSTTSASGAATVAGTTTASTGTTSGAATTSAAGASTVGGASNTAATLGLPIYTGLKPLSLGTVFEQTIAQSLIGQAGASAKYGIFSTSDTSDKVVSFYDTAMQQAGFSKAASQNIPNSGSSSGLNLGGQVVAYSKGSGSSANGAVVTILGPLDANSIALFGSQSPSAAQQLKPGDFMVFLFNNVNTGNLTLPGATTGSGSSSSSTNTTPTAKP